MLQISYFVFAYIGQKITIFFYNDENSYFRVWQYKVFKKSVLTRSSGVIGLYTAYLLLDKGYSPQDITIVAKHIPGDLSHDYASPYAGATVNTVKSEDKSIQFFYKFTYDILAKIRSEYGPEQAGIDFVFNEESWTTPPSPKALEFFKSYNSEWRELTPEQLPLGATYGLRYKTFVINSPKFIKWLYDYMVKKNVSIKVKEVSHILEASFPDTQYLFNCTGLGSFKLGGVEDKNCHPTRAQVVVVRAPHIKEVKLYWGKDANYMIKRPFSNDELILGGFYQKENGNRDVNGYETEDILKRVTKYFPILRDGETIAELDILRVVSAFRPGRHGGVRIEKEYIKDICVVHNYGAEGTGFVQGLGMAETAIKLIQHSSKL